MVVAKKETTRKYQAIWERLKSKKVCTIEVHPAVEARVKKAVIKEKNNDLGFKLLNDHDYFFLKVTKKEVGKGLVRLTFELRQRLGLEGIKL